MTRKERALEIIKRLHKVYPNAKIALNFKNSYELLIATILSAQATDVSVNLATPALFKEFPSPEALAKAEVSEIDKFIAKIRLK